MTSSTKGITATDMSKDLFALRKKIDEVLIGVPCQGATRFVYNASQTATYDLRDGYLVVDFRAGDDRRQMFVHINSPDKSDAMVRFAGKASVYFSIGDFGISYVLIARLLDQFGGSRWFMRTSLTDEITKHADGKKVEPYIRGVPIDRPDSTDYLDVLHKEVVKYRGHGWDDARLTRWLTLNNWSDDRISKALKKKGP